jgi:hypothetical protein
MEHMKVKKVAKNSVLFNNLDVTRTKLKLTGSYTFRRIPRKKKEKKTNLKFEKKEGYFITV